MEASKKPKSPKKLALLSVPLAVASPAIADLPATATETSQRAENSDAKTLSQSSKTSEVTANIPATNSPGRPTSYKVRSGDTVTAIAKRFNLSVSKIARLNNLGPSSLIRVGQVLKLTGPAPKQTAPESYKVRSGDTLSKIASSHGLSVAELAALNRIQPQALIYPGQVLRVARVIQSPEIPVNAPDSYQVQAGDSLQTIAKRFSLSVSNLREFNSLTKNSIIYVGQNLSLKPLPKPAADQSGDLGSPAAPAAAPGASVLSDGISTTDPMRPTGVCTIHGYHSVQAGESVSRIAAIYGVSTQAVLSANSLSWSSTIYVGQKLIIPGVHEIQNCPSLARLTPEMQSNAEVIYRVGKSLNVSDYGIVIALATAMQESSLKNIDYGDRDSIGLFQQRPSQGWGTKTQIMDPEYSARAFFGGPTGPNFGKVRGLLDIRNWSSLSLTKAAQAVQISAFPEAYQKWELSAWSWFDLINSGEN